MPQIKTWHVHGQRAALSESIGCSLRGQRQETERLLLKGGLGLQLGEAQYLGRPIAWRGPNLRQSLPWCFFPGWVGQPS